VPLRSLPMLENPLPRFMDDAPVIGEFQRHAGSPPTRRTPIMLSIAGDHADSTPSL